MISTVFNTLIYDPLYNGLIFLIDALPWADVGVVIIIFTVIVKLVLFPVSQKAARTQVIMRSVEPELKKIKEKYKNDKQEQAVKTMALYKEKNINPFSSIFLILIQIPIIFALYFVFVRGGLPTVDISKLYSFIPVPGSVDTSFLGLVDVTGRSLVLAFLTGLTQYIQVALISPKTDKGKKKKSRSSMGEDFARSMQLQMKYVMPVIIGVVAYTLPAMIAIYWTTSNLFMILQEFYIRKRIRGQTQDQERKT